MVNNEGRDAMEMFSDEFFAAANSYFATNLNESSVDSPLSIGYSVAGTPNGDRHYVVTFSGNSTSIQHRSDGHGEDRNSSAKNSNDQHSNDQQNSDESGTPNVSMSANYDTMVALQNGAAVQPLVLDGSIVLSGDVARLGKHYDVAAEFNQHIENILDRENSV